MNATAAPPATTPPATPASCPVGWAGLGWAGGRGEEQARVGLCTHACMHLPRMHAPAGVAHCTAEGRLPVGRLAALACTLNPRPVLALHAGWTFTVEPGFLETLLQSGHRTLDPEEAGGCCAEEVDTAGCQVLVGGRLGASSKPCRAPSTPACPIELVRADFFYVPVLTSCFIEPVRCVGGGGGGGVGLGGGGVGRRPLCCPAVSSGRYTRLGALNAWFQ